MSLLLPRTRILALLCTAALGAQTQVGYSASLRVLPAGTGQALSMDGTGVVYFTGTKLVLDTGSARRDLLAFQAPVFGSFTRRLDAHYLLFGESSNDGIWLVPLAANQTPRRLAGLKFNYDAVRWGSRHAIVSAKTGGFPAPDNELWAVDLLTGATDLIAKVPGASGPLAADPAGDLWYVTASSSFPPPPGASDLLRFRHAKVLSAFGPGQLGPADADAMHRGLDSASALAFDDDGDAFVVDWKNRRVVELDDVEQRSGRAHMLLDYGTASVDPLGLQFAPPASGTQPVFEPFQPARGGTLIVHESDFAASSRLRMLAPARATLHAEPGPDVPPGPFAMATRGAAPHGRLVVAIRFGHGHGELALDLGFEQPLLWHAGLLRPWQSFTLLADANGTARLPLVNPGIGFPLPLAAQSAFLSQDGRTIGSAAPERFNLR